MRFDFLQFEWYSPWYLLLFLTFLPLLYWDVKKKKDNSVLLPTLAGLHPSTSAHSAFRILKFLKYLILASLIFALARPRTYQISQNTDDSQGIDIMLSVDVSLSMLARDLMPDRLTALKDIAKRFVEQRTGDRIGLVAYSGEAFTKVPVTTDHQVVLDEIENLSPLELEQGTAIGEGLSVAVNHLKNSRAKSKIIILMTDGVNTIPNAMNPLIAANLAKNNDIKVYSIGIGTNGYALMPTGTNGLGELIFTETQVTIDEPMLREVAEETGGKYFRATSNQRLQAVYDEINQLEKSQIQVKKHYEYREYFAHLLWLALGLFLVYTLMRWIFFRTIN